MTACTVYAGNSDWEMRFYCELKHIKTSSAVIISIDFKSKMLTTLEQLFMYPHLLTGQIHCDMHTPVWLLQQNNKKQMKQNLLLSLDYVIKM